MQNSGARAQSQRKNFTIEATLWILATATILILHLNAVSVESQFRIMAAMGLVSISFGVRTFVIHGGGRITPTGLWGASTAMFFGLSGLLTAISQDRQVDPRYVTAALIICTVVQILVTALSWRTSAEFKISLPTVEISKLLSILGAGSLLALAAARVALPEQYHSILEHGAFAAIVTLATGLIWRPEVRLRSWPLVAVLACVVLYSEFFHSGTGRLRVVALVCALGVLITMRLPRRSIKIACALLSPAAIYLLAQDRLSLQESMGAQTGGRNGLESMIQPLLGFGRLMQAQADEGFPLRWGSSLLSYPAALLPRSWVPDRPEALGYELVLLWSPEKYGSGYSVVATVVGEGVFNFGIAIGVIATILALAASLRLLDYALLAVAQRQASVNSVIIFIIMLITAGAIGDLVWGGQHVFLSRTTMRLGLVVAVAAIAWFIIPPEPRTRPDKNLASSTRVSTSPRVYRSDARG